MKPEDVETTIRKIVANTRSIEITMIGDHFCVEAPSQSSVQDASLLAALRKMEESAQAAEDAWQRRRARLHELGIEDGDLYIAPATQILPDPGAKHDAFEIRRVRKGASLTDTYVWGTCEEMNALVTSIECGEPGATLDLPNCAYQVWNDPTGIREPRYRFYLPQHGEYSAVVERYQVLAMVKCWRARGPVDETHEDAGYPPIC